MTIKIYQLRIALEHVYNRHVDVRTYIVHYHDCELIVAHTSRLAFLAFDDSGVNWIFSLLHVFLDNGNRKARVKRGGYVMVTSPF